MKKFFAAVLFMSTLLNPFVSKADEGMWLPMFIERLNYVDMQKMGLQLTAEEIYSINHSSLKDAIVIFGGGCTGEIVSQNGLVFTNHHCGYGSIASLSSSTNNYLANGFFANTQEEELANNNGLSVKFLLRVEDVSKQILGAIPDDATEAERIAIVNKLSTDIASKAAIEPFQEANVKSFFYGNEYYLFVYETYPDVRLVMTPPSSIGRFGGDTDNWMWPRHTCDFSVFRVYSTADGKPAVYNKNNVPLKPKHFLPISLAPKKENDFTMVMGYPGSTQRYMISDGVDLAYKKINPAIVKIREKKLQIMDSRMSKSSDVQINYAGKYASTSNYWKYFIGQNRGIEKLNVIERKSILEDDFETWVNNDNIPKSDYYKDAIAKVRNSYAMLDELEYTSTYINECFMRGSDVVAFAWKFKKLLQVLSAEKIKLSDLNKELEPLKKIADDFFASMDFQTEKKMYRAMLEMYGNDVNSKFCPGFYKTIKNKFNNNYLIYTDYLFQVSIFTNKNKMDRFMEYPAFNILNEDPLFSDILQIYAMKEIVSQDMAPLKNQLNQGMRKFVKGMQEMQSEKKIYPDANFTMRLTYGKILTYNSNDAVKYNYYTTIDGVMEKEDSENADFIVPQKLKDLYKNKDFGQYAENGKLITCFITNNDITGGNSGSPVINGKGELIGLAFDGNWEAMSGNIVFEPDLQRCICVDIRYVLFIIEKYAGGKRIIDELSIVK